MSIRGETKVEICGVAIWVGRCFLSMVIECRIKVTHIIFQIVQHCFNSFFSFFFWLKFSLMTDVYARVIKPNFYSLRQWLQLLIYLVDALSQMRWQEGFATESQHVCTAAAPCRSVLKTFSFSMENDMNIIILKWW